MQSDRSLKFTGRKFSREEAYFRLVALNSASRVPVPKHFVNQPWPMDAFYNGGSRRCRYDGRPGELPVVHFEGVERRFIDVAVEAASRVPSDRLSRLEPLECGDPMCTNPHHWRGYVSLADVGEEWAFDPLARGFYLDAE